MLGGGVAAVGMRTKMAMAHCLQMMSRIYEETKGPFQRSWSRNYLEDTADVIVGIQSCSTRIGIASSRSLTRATRRRERGRCSAQTLIHNTRSTHIFICSHNASLNRCAAACCVGTCARSARSSGAGIRAATTAPSGKYTVCVLSKIFRLFPRHPR